MHRDGRRDPRQRARVPEERRRVAPAEPARKVLECDVHLKRHPKDDVRKRKHLHVLERTFSYPSADCPRHSAATEACLLDFGKGSRNQAIEIYNNEICHGRYTLRSFVMITTHTYNTKFRDDINCYI